MSRMTLTHRHPDDQVTPPVDTLAELRLLPVGDVEDKTLVYCAETESIFAYSYTSTESDNGSTIIEPTGGVGAWLATASATPAGGSGPAVVVPGTNPYVVAAGLDNGTLLAFNTTAGGLSVTLEASPAQNRYLILKNAGTGGNTLTVTLNGNTLDGSNSGPVLPDGDSISIVYDSVLGWLVI